jgi:hypothetical protein
MEFKEVFGNILKKQDGRIWIGFIWLAVLS